MKLFLAVFAAMLLSSFAGASPAPDAAGDGAAKNRQEVFRDIKVDGPMPLGQFIAMLREQDAQVQIVLAGSPQGLDQLMVPPLRLRNVAMVYLDSFFHRPYVLRGQCVSDRDEPRGSLPWPRPSRPLP